MLQFQIEYNTAHDECLYINIMKKGEAQPKSYRMSRSKGFYTYRLVTDVPVDYRYELRTGNGHIVERQYRHTDSTDCLLADVWRSPETPSDALYAGAFASAIFGPGDIGNPLDDHVRGKMLIRLREVRLNADEAFCIVSRQYINWNTEKAFVMTQHDNYYWEAQFDIDLLLKDFEFKFGIWDTKANRFKAYESGSNRVLNFTEQRQTVVATFDSFAYDHDWRAAGVAVPVFALRSTQSMGCGEFIDIKPLADWCEAARLRVIQLLPINDTTATGTWVDSYPYNAISIMALHPIYISVADAMAYYGAKPKAIDREEALYLNDNKFVDYEKTYRWKMRVLRKFFDDNHADIEADERLQRYAADNQWVGQYAAFSVLRDRYGTSDFRRWDEARYSNDIKAAVAATHEARFYIFLQYHLERQLLDAIGYAHSKHIAIKGDLPIGINPCSVEAWVEPELFDFSLQAGAPPDFFSRDGQNWGFPIYNWERMKSDGYQWWKKRLGRMQTFFDAFRIDHIVGFFRIWAIPKDFRSGLMGHFAPAMPYTEAEIRQMNFAGSPEYFSLPVVRRQTIDRCVGEYAQAVDDELFEVTGMGHRRMKKEYFSRMAADAWVATHVRADAALRVRNGLYDMMHEVFFIAAGGGRWHPRISLMQTELYGQMSHDEQNSLRDIHDNYFYNRHNEFWKQSATQRLEGMLGECRMLVCGEDLGMIPASVPVVMQRLQILSLEQQRMPKLSWERYGNCARYQYMSVCATSSHDISSIRGWWEENADETQYYYSNVMHHSGPAPHPITPSLAAEVVQMHVASPSMLCINPIQDYMAIDATVPHLLPHEERINEPANAHHYWRYRIPVCIDRLGSYDVTRLVAEMVERCGRK